MKTQKQSKVLTFITMLVLVSMLLVPTGNIRAQAAQPPAPASPFDGNIPSGSGAASTAGASSLRSSTSLSVFQKGADRLLAFQNPDGGFQWQVIDPPGASPTNIIGPTAQGLAEAFYHTIDPGHLAALKNAGTFLLSEGGERGKFSPSAGYLAVTLDSIFGGTTYTSYVKTNYYDKLAAGTYVRDSDGNTYNTASYVQSIRNGRTGNITTMACWDIGIGLVSAALIGADTGPWITGVEAEVNELDGAAPYGKYYDVIGLGAALHGLSLVGATFDPTAGLYAGASNLQDLGDILATFQTSDGGFTYDPDNIIPDNDGVQYTAYAMLGLNQLDRARYLTVIQNAATYLAGTQLPTGGWLPYPPYTADPVYFGENNEITGEALWSMSVADGGYPLSDIYVCPVADGDCGHPGASTHSIQAAIDAVGHSTVYIAAGTYTENVVVDKSVEIVGAGQGLTIVQPAVSNPNPCTGSSLCGGAASNVFLIQADNVVIHDLTVDGDNPALTSSYDLGGANVDARNGIIKNTDATYNGLEVYNVTVQNIYLRGIYSTGGSFNFHDNIVTNVQGDGYSIGMFAWYGPGIMQHNTVSYANDAISANHSNGIQFLNNTVTFSGSGVHTDNAGDSGGVADLIQGNHVDCTGSTLGKYGIWTFVPYIAPTVNINTIINCDPGLAAFGQGAAVTPQFTNNTVTGNGSPNSAGIYITTDLISWGYSDVSVNFTGNTVTGFNYGIELEAGLHSTWGNTYPYTAQTINATFSTNNISGNTVGLAEAVDSTGGGGTYTASASPNWWGDASGPLNTTSNPGGLGNEVVPTNVVFDPWCLNASCSGLQLPLPSSFYGYIHYYTGSASGSVDAFVPDVTPAVRSATIALDAGVPAYQMDVPGNVTGLSGKNGGLEGETITFKIGSVVLGTHTWNSGTNTRLNFHPPEAVIGGPYNALTGVTLNFNGSANDWGIANAADVITYAWDMDGNGSYETTAQNTTKSWSTVGDYTVGLQVTDSLRAVATATTTVHIASISSPLGGLSAVYDGSPHAATATVNPSSLAISFTYNGSSTAPTAAGTYAVVASIAGYSGTITGTLVIDRATSAVTVTCPTTPQTYTGSAITPCTAAYSGAGSLSGSLNPTYLNNLNVGTATANATYAGDSNHYGSSGTNTFTIAKATATIILSNLNPVYDGNPKSPTVTTVPASLAYTIVYTPGGSVAPTDPGTYTFVVTINNANYSGTASGTMHIQRTHSLTLVPGWNLVSFNLVPMDTLTGTVLANIAGKYDLVYGWDGTKAPGNTWMKYAPGGPPYANDLKDLHETMGFWIHVTSTSNIVLNVNGNAPTSTDITLSATGGGWNLVGFPKASGSSGFTDLPGALSVSNFSLVYAYHAFDTADQWKLFDNAPGVPGFANDLKFLEPGWGYWVQMSGADETWTVAY